jgi:hypothetical protein
MDWREKEQTRYLKLSNIELRAEGQNDMLVGLNFGPLT